MHEVVYHLKSPKQLVKTKTESSVLLKADDVFAETVYSVVSTGTELAAWNGLEPLRPTQNVYPRLVGYCNMACVKEVGSNVRNIKIGEYILTHQAHRSSFLCNQREIIYKTTTTDSDLLKKITATYLYHLGYIALQKADFQPGHTVAVIGMGVLGVTTATLAKAFAANPCCFTNQLTDIFTSKFQLANVYSKDGLCDKPIQELKHLDGFDIVINTSNHWDDHLLSMKLARKGGAIVNLGFPGRGCGAPNFNPLDSQYYYDKQLTMMHCGHIFEDDINAIDIRFNLKRNIRYLVELIENNLICPLDLVSVESTWSGLQEVYQILSERKPALFTALLDWRK